jgi:hypothetical protein
MKRQILSSPPSIPVIATGIRITPRVLWMRDLRF